MQLTPAISLGLVCLAVSVLQISLATDTMFSLENSSFGPTLSVALAGFAGYFLIIMRTMRNVTELDKKNQELNQTVNKLQMVAEEVQTRNRELEFLATHDSLTLLLNRRALNKGLEREFNEARQVGRALSCIMCDIDHFKSVNDRCGHAAGDQVIKLVAAILQKNSRESDLVGRYGGEEFCIVLPGLDIQQTAKIAGRIRRAVQEDSVAGVTVTMSFGVSSLHPKAREPVELVNQADRALYNAKEYGRNRVIAWDDEEMTAFASQYEKRKAKKEDRQRKASRMNGRPVC